MALIGAYPTLVKDCHDILFDAFKATFVFGDTKYSDMIAERFASSGGPRLAQAIHSYVMQAEVTGNTLPGQTAAAPGGAVPVTPIGVKGSLF